MSLTRRLAAILAADVAGYSLLMGADEEGTRDRLNTHRQPIRCYGADAEVEAARRLISCSIAGTLMGNSFWLRIKQAIVEFKPRRPDHCARAVGSTG